MDSVAEPAIRRLAGALHGTLIRPADPGYDAARRLWNGRFDRRPGLIVRCADTADVTHAVDFARAESVEVAVRGGGHSFAGHSGCDGGLVIDLSTLKGLKVDQSERTVDAEPGVLTREVDAATREPGLAMVLGGCDSVGVGGFTLGGGEGSLSGKYGLGCDNLLATTVVVADGRVVTASADQHSDLFWGLRGGGGNFGVVTWFRFRVHPLTEVVAGRLVYGLAKAAAVLRGYREFAPSAPDEITCGLTFAAGSSGPALILELTYAGSAGAAEPVLRTLRGFAKPDADMVATVGYHQYRLESPGPPAGFPSTVRGAFLPDLPDDVIDALTALAAQVPPAAELEINHLHGAVSRVPLGASAFPLRRPGYDCFAIAGWPVPELRDRATGWVQRVYDVLRAHAAGAYVNLLNDDEAGRVRAAYGPQFARLVSLKQTYDPGNLFRLNHNIPPNG
jgi:FAD/FMN-containing dehydrogenase